MIREIPIETHNKNITIYARSKFTARQQLHKKAQQYGIKTIKSINAITKPRQGYAGLFLARCEKR